MKTFVSWILGLACLWAGMSTAFRLQHWPDAVLIEKCGTALCEHRGSVGFIFWSGDYLVKKSDGQTVIVPSTQWAGMSYSSGAGGLGWPCAVAWMAGLLGFVYFTLGGFFRGAFRRFQEANPG